MASLVVQLSGRGPAQRLGVVGADPGPRGRRHRPGRRLRPRRDDRRTPAHPAARLDQRRPRPFVSRVPLRGRWRPAGGATRPASPIDSPDPRRSRRRLRRLVTLPASTSGRPAARGGRFGRTATLSPPPHILRRAPRGPPARRSSHNDISDSCDPAIALWRRGSAAYGHVRRRRAGANGRAAQGSLTHHADCARRSGFGRRFVSKDTVVGGYGSRLRPFSRVTRLVCAMKRQPARPAERAARHTSRRCAPRPGTRWSTREGAPVDGDVALVLSSLVDYRNETAWADAHARARHAGRLRRARRVEDAGAVRAARRLRRRSANPRPR